MENKEQMRFNSPEQMLDAILNGEKDLYNVKTGDYVFHYSESGSIAVYNLTSEEAEELDKKAIENGEYWGAFLGGGGEIWDDPERAAENEQDCNLDYCKKVYALDGWVDVSVYAKSEEVAMLCKAQQKDELLKIAKPVLFNTEMVRAILNGTKTCTRRVIKPQPTYSERDGFSWKGHAYGTVLPPTIQGAIYNFCCAAQYKIGDILYVRETWCELSYGYEYKADGETIDHLGNVMKWHPSIHMPKEAARIFLKITGVRAERLQDITEEEAVKEGCQAGYHEYQGAIWGQEDTDEWTAVEDYERVWYSTLKKTDIDKYDWDANPWVWVYDFEVVKIS